MISLNDLFFAIWIFLSLGFVLLTPGKISRQSYSRFLLAIFFISCFVTIWFHETVIDVSKTSPVHGSLMVLSQMFTMTLTSKLWLKFELDKMSIALRKTIYVFFYVSLLAVIVCAYWLYKLIPELQLILYPFASLAISVTADMVETRWKNQASGF